MAEQSNGIMGALQNRFARLVGRPTAGDIAQAERAERKAQETNTRRAVEQQIDRRVRDEANIARQAEVSDRVAEHAAAATPDAAETLERVPTGVWDNVPAPYAGKVEQFWRDRYATTNVAMSPIDNAPDGFPISATGERSLGFFDAQAQRKALVQDHTTFRELDAMFKERAELLDENIKRANGPDKVRLELLSKVERTSFEAESASFLRGKPRYSELLDKSRENFTALMDYDRDHNHPIANPDREMSLAKPSPQEQFNWLHRHDDGHAARTAPQRPGWMANEHDDLVIRHNILQTVAQPHPTETAPLEIRNAMKQELNERIAAREATAQSERDGKSQGAGKQALSDGPAIAAPAPVQTLVEQAPDVAQSNVPPQNLPSLKGIGVKLGAAEQAPKAEARQPAAEQIVVDPSKRLDLQHDAYDADVRPLREQAKRRDADLSAKVSQVQAVEIEREEALDMPEAQRGRSIGYSLSHRR